MNNIKSIILTSIFILSGLILKGQTPGQNLDKYWNYKERLTTKFMVVENPLSVHPLHIDGINLPANWRNPTNNFDNHNQIKWADAEHHLGYYLAVLATEYKLLTIHNENTSETVTGIKYLLQTIERLDYRAEGEYGLDPDYLCRLFRIYGGQIELVYPYDENCLNGFFIRDDVPGEGDDAYNGFSDYWKDNGYPAFNNVLTELSDYHQVNPEPNEMSQDQVWNLLQGLALVKKLVDHPNTYTVGDGQHVTLKKWAQKITHRIVNFMHGGNTSTTYEFCGIFSDCWPGHWVDVYTPLWLIRNPVTDEIVDRGGDPEDLYLNAYLFAEAGNWITNQQWGDLHYNSMNEPNTVLPLPISNYWNNHAKIALSCIINSSSGYFNSFRELMHQLYKIANGPKADEEDGYNSHLGGDYARFTFVHFPLMYIVLHDINISRDNYYYHYYMSYVERLLNLAHPEGPSTGLYDINNNGTIDDNDYTSEFWATNGKRLVKPVGKDLPDNYKSKHREFNGIDYMLLYRQIQKYRLYFHKNPE